MASRYYRPRLNNKPVTATNVEALLRSLQDDIERCGSEHAKQRRRLLLRGFRAALWLGVEKPRLGELAQELRAELFGHPLVLATDDDDEQCRPGTDDEVMK